MNNENNKLIQHDDGYLNRNHHFFNLFVIMFISIMGAAASLNDILITQFKLGHLR